MNGAPPRPSTSAARARWLSLLILGAVVATGVAVQLWLELTPAPATELTGELDRLISWSALGARERWIAAWLVALRVAWIWLRPRVALEPLLDLPLLGFLAAMTGGGFSPLDPALPIAYVAATLFLPTRAGRRSRRWLTVRLLVGLALIHVIVTWHDRERLTRSAELQRRGIENMIAEMRDRHEPAVESLDGLLQELPTAEASDPLRRLHQPLASSRDLFRRFLRDLDLSLDPEDVDHLQTTLVQDAKQYLEEDYFVARERWMDASAQQREQVDVPFLDQLRGMLVTILNQIESDLERLNAMLGANASTRQQLEDLQSRNIQRRALISLGILLFAGIALALRDHLRETVRRVQEERSRRDLEVREQEKDNWIAVTAGLTHGLGNDILAYDIYLTQMVRELEARPDRPVPAPVLERIRFLRDSNKGRLAFLQFLEAFARHRKAAGQATGAALSHAPVDLVPLFQRVRRTLALVETADLPAKGSDPAVDRQIARFRDLPLFIESRPGDAAILHRGHTGVLDFFAYELLKNALRSATGERPLKLDLSRQAGALRLRLTNDVRVLRLEGSCPICQQPDRTLTQLERRRDASAACSECFPAHMQRLLCSSFEPGQGGGTGLGLFLIRYFLTTYYQGQIAAGISDPSIPEVFFEIEIPDAEPVTEARHD